MNRSEYSHSIIPELYPLSAKSVIDKSSKDACMGRLVLPEVSAGSAGRDESAEGVFGWVSNSNQMIEVL